MQEVPQRSYRFRLPLPFWAGLPPLAFPPAAFLLALPEDLRAAGATFSVAPATLSVVPWKVY